MSSGDKVRWKDIADLAKRVDALYVEKCCDAAGSPLRWCCDCPENNCPDGSYSSAAEDCVGCCTDHYLKKFSSGSFREAVTYRPYVTGAESGGMPVLQYDKTCPYSFDFDREITMYQRFEVAYSNAQYQDYYTGKKRPVLHSEFLVPAADSFGSTFGNEEFPDGTLRTFETTQVRTSDIADFAARNGYPGFDEETVANLVELVYDTFYTWYPFSQTGRQFYRNFLSAELFFVTNYDAAMCPCQGVYRLAFTGGKDDLPASKNGYVDTYTEYTIPFMGTQLTGPSFFHKVEWAELGTLTLHEPTWKYMPMGDGSTGSYPHKAEYKEMPPTGNCPQVLFPNLQEEGGGANQGSLTAQAMFDYNIWAPEYPGAVTKPFTLVAGPYDQDYYLEHQEQIFHEHPHCPADAYMHYANANWSRFETWTICASGWKGTVQVANLLFSYNAGTEENPSWKCVIRVVPVALTLTLPGKLQPAMRRRWYDLIYYKLRHIAGYLKYPLVTGTAYFPDGKPYHYFTSQDMLFRYPVGASWSYEGSAAGQNSITAYDHPLWQALRAGFGWEVRRCNGTTDTGGVPYYGQPSWSKTAPLGAYSKDEWLGEKFLEQLLCRFNFDTSTMRVECPPQGSPQPASPRFNAEGGGYCMPYLVLDPLEEKVPDRPGTYKEPLCTTPLCSFPDYLFGEGAVVYVDYLPWTGGCANTVCSEASGDSFYKTHWYSYTALTSLVELVEDKKMPERDMPQKSIIPVTDWTVIDHSWDTHESVHCEAQPGEQLTVYPGKDCCDLRMGLKSGDNFGADTPSYGYGLVKLNSAPGNGIRSRSVMLDVKPTVGTNGLYGSLDGATCAWISDSITHCAFLCRNPNRETLYLRVTGNVGHDITGYCAGGYAAYTAPSPNSGDGTYGLLMASKAAGGAPWIDATTGGWIQITVTYGTTKSSYNTASYKYDRTTALDESIDARIPLDMSKAIRDVNTYRLTVYVRLLICSTGGTITYDGTTQARIYGPPVVNVFIQDRKTGYLKNWCGGEYTGQNYTLRCDPTTLTIRIE